MILPAYADLLGATLAPDDPGGPALVMPFADHVVGRPGFLHGGAIAGLLELAALTALRHALGDVAVGIKPVNITVDFQRGGRAASTRAAGKVTRLGSRIANVTATAWQEDRNRPIATAHLNCLLDRR